VPEAARGVNGAPQLEVYAVSTADPDMVVKMLQTLLHNDPNVILTADKDGGKVVAFATPPQQATIKATIDQMQKESKQVDVIGLSNVDPQVAVVAINKLFGSNDEKPDPKAPRVDADLTTRSLLVRGTAGQVAQIRELLHKLGETEEEGGTAAAKSKQHVRLLPLSGAAARSAISQIEQIWPSVRTNKIRIVSPTAAVQSYRPGDSPNSGPTQQPAASPSDESNEQLQQLWQTLIKERNAPANEQPKPSSDGAKVKEDKDRATRDEITSRFRLVATDVEPATLQKPAAKPAPAATPKQMAAPTTPPAGKGAQIIIAPGPGGTLIASDDLEALDQLEDLLSTVGSRSAGSEREYAVFYLKYSKAPIIAEVLAAIFGGTAGGKDKGIIGDLASNALGGVGGGLMGDLLLGGGGGGGGGAFASGAVDIVPDARLNALLVHAKPADLDTVEQLLKVLDQHSGPENVEAEAQARPIAVFNTSAAEVAQIVQQVYQDRMASGGSAVMSPQDMMKMIRGGGNNADQQVQKMSIAVDSRNNILIVRAPDTLFKEVKALVNELDQSLADSPQTTKVVSLQHTNSAAVQKALTSMLGNVKTSTTAATSPTSMQPGQTASQGGGDDDSPEDRVRRAMRRNWEMMQEMRRMQGEGGDRGGERGGSDRGRFGRGGPDRGRGGDGERGGRGGEGRRGE
jgi:type II secretory pathway component GspD/PulD (secretin)